MSAGCQEHITRDMLPWFAVRNGRRNPGEAWHFDTEAALAAWEAEHLGFDPPHKSAWSLRIEALR